MLRIRSAFALITLTFVMVYCSTDGMMSPEPVAPRHIAPAALPTVRISEIHYDNTGTDTGEAIEVSGPAGTNLTGWSIVLYNGSGGAVYDTDALTGSIPATCGPRGVVVLSYPSNGIQNGSPDGVALVNAGVVVEFLSYEGTFTAVGGVANGMTSTDIGTSELGSEPVGRSLQRSGSGGWSGPIASTFGACNDDDEPSEVDHVVVAPSSATISEGTTQQFTATAYDAANEVIPGVTFTWSSTAEAVATVDGNGLATGVAEGDADIVATAPNDVAGSADLHVEAAPPPPPPGPTFFTEIHYDNAGGDIGEAIEIEGPAGTPLTGWSVVLYNGSNNASYSTRALSGIIPNTCDGRGVVVVAYSPDGIQNGSPDGFALINGSSQVVEFLSYEGTMTAAGGPANGVLSTDIEVFESTASTVGNSLQRFNNGEWYPPRGSSFGVCNGDPPPPPPSTISFSGRVPSDPALPVGFQDQLFATLRDPNGTVVTTTFTWSSDTPSLASIDQDGVVTALDAGTMILRATASDPDGTTDTYSLPSHFATASATADYEGNAEFGEPTDGNPDDDYILRHAQFTSSYNAGRGTPNWVSYNLEASHFGPEDRCDCFTFDPALPMPYTHYTTANYTGAGAFHGYGIDRGHLARSFDRTAGSLDNAFTYLFSNIIPQAADLNQGPWAEMENDLGDFARFDNREVYIVTGVAGSKGTVKNEGLITIPAQVWKVAVVMDRDEGLEDVHGSGDIEVIAVIMPNDPGVRDVDWQTYETTVDAVEAASGYDLLALLPDNIEIAVESGTSPPTAVTDGPYSSLEGASVAMDGGGSSDPDDHTLTYAWTFGDGGNASGSAVSHTYTQDGAYTVRLIVTDELGLADTTETTATVANVAPSIDPFSGATLLTGETYSAAGTFSDPGADSWSATVDYGDGSGQAALALSGMSFSLSHTYASPGTFTVTVRISDDDATSTRTQTVVVWSPIQGIQNAKALVAQLVAAGKLSSGDANWLNNKLDLAIKQLEKGNRTPALNQLEHVLARIDSLVASGQLSAADAQPLRSMVERIVESL